MIVKKFATLFLLIITFLGCNHTYKKSIKRWEHTQHACTIIAYQKIAKPKVFLAKDSIYLLQTLRDSLYRLKLQQLAIQIDSAQKAYSKAKFECEQIENPLLKKAYKLGVASLLFKYKQLQQVDSVYRNHIEITEFQHTNQQILKYTQAPQTILGYTIQVEFSGTEGALPPSTYKKTYFLNKNKTVILAEF